jgi:hypothetical protein
MMSGGGRRPGKITGTWPLKDGILTKIPKKVTGDANDKSIPQKVLAIGKAANGESVLVFDGPLTLLTEDRSGLPVYEKQN